MLTFRVYVSRLFFELIADQSYGALIKSAVPSIDFFSRDLNRDGEREREGVSGD